MPMSTMETMTRTIPPPSQAPQGLAPSTHQEYVHRAAWKAGVMGAINVLCAVLATRLILLLAVCGGFCLALLALDRPGTLGILLVYTIAVVVPLTALSAWR
jgi:hypothetical protein